VTFEFGDKTLWIDNVPTLSQAEIWLELKTDDVTRAKRFCKDHGVAFREEIEFLPQGFNGFWISSPANIIHLISQ
jgi:hypothetical protein